MTQTIITVLILSILLAWIAGFSVVDKRWGAYNWSLFLIFLFSLFLFSALIQTIRIRFPYPWMPVVGFGLFLFLFILALTPAERVRWSRRIGMRSMASPENIATTNASVGFFSWLLLFFLLVLLFSSFWYWWPWNL